VTEHTSSWRPRGSPYEFFNGLKAKHLLTGCNSRNRVQSVDIEPARARYELSRVLYDGDFNRPPTNFVSPPEADPNKYIGSKVFRLQFLKCVMARGLNLDPLDLSAIGALKDNVTLLAAVTALPTGAKQNGHGSNDDGLTEDRRQTRELDVTRNWVEFTCLTDHAEYICECMIKLKDLGWCQRLARILAKRVCLVESGCCVLAHLAPPFALDRFSPLAKSWEGFMSKAEAIRASESTVRDFFDLSTRLIYVRCKPARKANSS